MSISVAPSDPVNERLASREEQSERTRWSIELEPKFSQQRLQGHDLDEDAVSFEDRVYLSA